MMKLHKHVNMIKTVNLIIVVVFFIVFSASKDKALASSGDTFFGEVNPFTGTAVGEDTEETEEESTVFQVSDTSYFDTKTGLYGFPTSRGDVYANVADGMITQNSVTVYLPEGMEAVIYKDGLSAAFTGGDITEDGGYMVEAVIDGNAVSLLSFTIVGSESNKILNFTAPTGFRVISAEKDGAETNFSRNYVDMSEEGRYLIGYELSSAGISYYLDLIVDVTPPTLTFAGIDEDGKARGPVSIIEKGENDTISVVRDGEALNLILTYTFTQSGKYVVTVTDPAGNSTEYPFTIMIYLDRNGWIFGLLFIAVIAAVVAYIIYKRKHLKVR